MNMQGHERLLFKILQLNYPMTWISANMLDKCVALDGLIWIKPRWCYDYANLENDCSVNLLTPLSIET